MRPAPFPCDGCSQAEIVGSMNIAAQHRDEEGRHLVLSTAKRRYRLNICGETTETEPLAYVLPGDAFWETRQAAVCDFHDHCRLGHVKKLRSALRPVRQSTGVWSNGFGCSMRCPAVQPRANWPSNLSPAMPDDIRPPNGIRRASANGLLAGSDRRSPCATAAISPC